MKTAIQEAIEIIEERLKILSTVQRTESTMGAIAGYQYSKYLLMELLEKEKEQIMNACIRFGNLNGVDIEDYIEYYNEISKSLKPIELPSDEEIEEKANKIPIGKWETGVDEEGGYYIEPNTNEKWRWGGSMVGKGQSYILYNVEYIEKEAEKRFPYEKHMGDIWGNGLHEGFIIGAEWMKEQILNQNK